ncbi:MAG TPA: response regulator [Ideonella sp.]|nr:response regulator [Ideonella sp.]
MNQRTVYIVDDNPEFRDSACFWLQSAGFEVRAWGDPREALQDLAHRDRGESACLLLDVRMPQLSGLDVYDALRKDGQRLPVIYMSGHADVPLAVEAMRKGAVSLLEKPLDDAALEAALDSAFTAQEAARTPPSAPGPVARPVSAPLADGAAVDEFARRERSLAPREREVLAHVVQGTYNKVIADRIGLSIKTVELYRARGMAKMKARSVAELTRMMVSRQA